MILRGNHKSAQLEVNAATLKKMDKEVQRGWALAITMDSVHHIKYLGIIPLGLDKQFSMN